MYSTTRVLLKARAKMHLSAHLLFRTYLLLSTCASKYVYGVDMYPKDDTDPKESPPLGINAKIKDFRVHSFVYQCSRRHELAQLLCALSCERCRQPHRNNEQAEHYHSSDN
jgi:hypothetical protein